MNDKTKIHFIYIIVIIAIVVILHILNKNTETVTINSAILHGKETVLNEIISKELTLEEIRELRLPDRKDQIVNQMMSRNYYYLFITCLVITLLILGPTLFIKDKVQNTNGLKKEKEDPVEGLETLENAKVTYHVDHVKGVTVKNSTWEKNIKRNAKEQFKNIYQKTFDLAHNQATVKQVEAAVKKFMGNIEIKANEVGL